MSMTPIREVLRNAVTTISLGAAFELIVIGATAASIVLFWLLVQP
jgi:hypothetical protein